MNHRLFNILFPTSTGILYLIFLALDMSGINNSYSLYIKYSCIVICCAAALYICLVYKTVIVGIAMVLTLFADTFLLLLDRYYIAGVTAFAAVQTIYALYIAYTAGTTGRNTHLLPVFLRYIIPRIIIYIITLLIVIHCFNVDSVAIISLWSYTNLIINVIQAALISRYNSSFRILALGLLLFLGCDTCVGLVNMTSYTAGLIPYTLIPAISYLIWLFYLPSQVLIIMHYHNTSDYHTEGVSSSRFFSILISILTALFILSSSISAPILIRPFYYIQIDMRNLDSGTGYTGEQIREAYDDMLDYCIGTREEFSTGDLEWSESGKSHFTDVRGLFILDIAIMTISGILLILYVIFRRITGYTPYSFRGHTPYYHGSICLLITFIIIGGLCAIDFDRAFIVFHKIFFPGKGNWIFDPDTDQIIRILPEEFFASCGALILSVLLILCSIFIIKSLTDRHRQ